MKRARAKTPDVVIVGAGVMGCATAWDLARSGLRVTVLERSVPGAEASSAAAGILGAQTEAHAGGALFELGLKSRARYPEWATALLESTGIDIEFRPSGVLRASLTESALRKDARALEFQRKLGLTVGVLDSRRLRAKVPSVSREAAGAVWFPDDARLDPPKLLRALRIAAERSGASFQSGAMVKRVVVERDHARGVELDDGSVVRGETVVVAAGSWSGLVGGVPLPPGGVVPARGQIVELELAKPLFGEVLFGPACYLVPRDDGRLLVGSTLEFVGYKKEVTAIAVRNLLDAALNLVPALADANLGRSWSNFRPYTQSGAPMIGQAGIPGLLLATGHYRNGILLAPITAEIVTALVHGRAPPAQVPAITPARRARKS
jgi:glycine oxidase